MLGKIPETNIYQLVCVHVNTNSGYFCVLKVYYENDFYFVNEAPSQPELTVERLVQGVK